MERDYKLDTAKGLMILLVVFGHFIEVSAGWDSVYGKTIMEIIFMVHMPAFIFMAGMTFNIDKWKIRTLQILTLYIFLQVIYSSFFLLNGTMSIYEFILKPYWLLWFLVSLASFYIICGILNPEYKLLIVFSVCSCIVGFATISSYELSWVRTIVFLPFFVSGYLCKTTSNAIFTKKKILISLSILAIVVTILCQVCYKLWFGVYRFDEMGYGLIDGPLSRLFALACSISLTLSVISLMPKNDNFIGLVGRKSLSIYAYHGFFVIVSGKIISMYFTGVNEIIMVALSIALSFITSTAICLLPLELLTRKIMDLPLKIKQFIEPMKDINLKQ
ncbi:acyltransferase family protein [Escherichia albertii]|uniref:acyltransferase family protein n=1 Tax=Escherichia albertii TaxID=208962 RepID=UPI001484D447|nr:acyltransferase family protein [Escherichia albertii]MCZ8596396.1 acyltransferase family protein [Escherichia albertii]WDB23179.1 acyltransferase family protein [Escherichia albertii]